MKPNTSLTHIDSRRSTFWLRLYLNLWHIWCRFLWSLEAGKWRKVFPVELLNLSQNFLFRFFCHWIYCFSPAVYLWHTFGLLPFYYSDFPLPPISPGLTSLPVSQSLAHFPSAVIYRLSRGSICCFGHALLPPHFLNSSSVHRWFPGLYRHTFLFYHGMSLYSLLITHCQDDVRLILYRLNYYVS